MSGNLIGLILMILGGGSGGDLLDFIPTEDYWQRQGVQTVTPMSMTDVLEDEDADPSDRLMAIRALGEMGFDESIEILTPLVDSNEPFVGAYARRSIAWITGDDPEGFPALDRENLDADLALLGEKMTMVGQVMVTNGPGAPVDWESIVPEFPEDHWQSKDEITSEMLGGLFELLAMFGNMRLDAVTFGLEITDFNDEPETMVFVGRGEYDRWRVLDFIEEEMSGNSNAEMDMYSIGDTEVISMVSDYESFAILMPADDRFVLLVDVRRGNAGEGLPIDDVADLIESSETEPALSEVLEEQLEYFDRDNLRAWMVLEIMDGWKQGEPAEVFGAFDAARFTASQPLTGGDIRIDWNATGTNAAAVSETADRLNGYIAEGVADLRQEMEWEPEMRKMFQPMIGLLESMEIEADGTELTGGMTIKDGAAGILPMFLMGF